MARRGYRLAIRPCGRERSAAPVSGAVPGRTSREARGSWRSRGIYDGGEDRQGAAAVGALFTSDSEPPFEQLGPTDAG
ncbi:MAG TPA: hypothetical protein VE735_08575 [Gammaproteobacteria bacterium]|nr:hypothetical protein [Gammaproteobacteria bacterium]